MGDARMSSGSEFQTVGASKAKLKPNCFVEDRPKQCPGENEVYNCVYFLNTITLWLKLSY